MGERCEEKIRKLVDEILKFIAPPSASDHSGGEPPNTPQPPALGSDSNPSSPGSVDVREEELVELLKEKLREMGDNPDEVIKLGESIGLPPLDSLLIEYSELKQISLEEARRELIEELRRRKAAEAAQPGEKE